MIQQFDTETNFWEMHPEFKAAGKSKEVYQKDRSKDKKKSSLLMWTIALIWDLQSKYYGMSEDGEDNKIDLLFAEVYGDKEYYYKNQGEIFDLRLQYIKMQDSVAKRALRDINEKLDERAKFLKTLRYEFGDYNEKGQLVGNTSTIIDKMLVDTKKIYDLLDQAQKVVDEENAAAETKGGGQVSLGDRDEI
jgi:hypothetical protein